HRGGAASHGAPARPVTERGADPPAHGRVPDAGLLSRGSGRSGAPGAATASDPIQWVAAHAGRRGVVEWARPSSRARAVRRRGEDLQALARRLRPRSARPRHPGRGAALRLIERVGRGRCESLRIPGRVVQPRERARGRAGPARGRGRRSARSAAPVIRSSPEKESVPPKVSRHLLRAPRRAYRRLPSFFRFTYYQSFLVMSEGPIGLLPKRDSSESPHPLKLIE